jgi:hypothetical protein
VRIAGIVSECARRLLECFRLRFGLDLTLFGLDLKNPKAFWLFHTSKATYVILQYAAGGHGHKSCNRQGERQALERHTDPATTVRGLIA